jgi:hypothetical protein
MELLNSDTQENSRTAHGFSSEECEVVGAQNYPSFARRCSFRLGTARLQDLQELTRGVASGIRSLYPTQKV